MTDEIPYKEIYERVLKEASEEFGFVFSPKTDLYAMTINDIVAMFVPSSFSITKIKENLELLTYHEDAISDIIDDYLDEYRRLLKKLEKGENGVVRTAIDALVATINQEIIDYICYRVAEELIHERFGSKLKRYEEDLRNLRFLKSKHKSKQFRKYLDKLFKEEYGDDSVRTFEIIKEEPVPHKDEFSIIELPPPEYMDVFNPHNDINRKVVAERYGITLDKVDEFIDEMEEENIKFHSREWQKAEFERLKREGVFSREWIEKFMKKKKEGEKGVSE